MDEFRIIMLVIYIFTIGVLYFVSQLIFKLKDERIRRLKVQNRKLLQILNDYEIIKEICKSKEISMEKYIERTLMEEDAE